MKVLKSKSTIPIPSNVQVVVRNRKVTVTGPRGTLKRVFRHQSVEISKVKNKVYVVKHFGSRKEIAAVQSIAGHIGNMVTGVTKGFEYKMKFVYAHFPVNANIVQDGKQIEIRNFLGEKLVRRVDMLDGVTVERSSAKDEIILKGNDVDNVSQSAASIHDSTLVKNKDIRMFLDGIYVSEKGHVENDD